MSSSNLKYLRRIGPLALVVSLLVGCGPTSDEARYDPALDNLRIEEINPGIVLLGSQLVVRGRSFVGLPWGSPSLIFSGDFQSAEETRPIEFSHPMQFVDLGTLETTIDAALLGQFGESAGVFRGTVVVSIASTVDGQKHRSAPLETSLDFRSELTPTLVGLENNGAIFINEEITVSAEDLLLGDGEGSTFARVEGCFTARFTGGCIDTPISESELFNVASPATSFDRTQTTFVYSPDISGIAPGEFVGTLTLVNRHADGRELRSESIDLRYEIRKPELFSASPLQVSIGKYLYVSGGGFIQSGQNASSLLELNATYTPDDGRPESIELILVPEFVAGETLRYTISEDDALGQTLDLRAVNGTLVGTLRLLLQRGEENIDSRALPISIDLSPVKQVVFLDFGNQYLDALRSFGLRAMDANIRERVIDNIQHSFHNINLDVRDEKPDDFSLFSTVQIGGHDPNGLGLLGYDNTPGKDVGNLRLHDNIGGVNSTTQDDGYPGYGGVFIESLFLFSKHPGEFASSSSLSDPLFDEVFDPFRPDMMGKPVRAADLAAGQVTTSDAPPCPGTSRSEQIGCAVWVLGNLIGSTISHELGHSLGLANPYGENSHHNTDAVNRLMDSGNGRPFDERAELRGRGPGVFCDDAYLYLRDILTTPEQPDYNRPSCL
ncbi:MAG: hypothetical protein JKY56_09240 [Kofleriaceae bacterium]|nr:hypothetical protein [Kofleriaceae bacterium]